MATGVSVIVCCYNSVSRLSETLNHLINQKITGFGFEIIIVDNASTDNTATYAQKILAGTANINFSIVAEPESGLSHARKKGYATACYEYLLFCDDDNWLAQNYVQLAYDTMLANRKIGILGGLATAVFESAEPAWFKKYEIDFAVGEQSVAKECLSQVGEVYGAGFTIRKSYLNKLFASGFKSILSDRKGNELISGGDTELCYLAGYFGFEVWYNRELQLKHFMTKNRLAWSYLKKLYYGKGRTVVYTQVYVNVMTGKYQPLQNLRFPFWLDTFIYKAKLVIKLYPQVIGKMNEEGNPLVLRYVAMKGEVMEIWNLKETYLQVFDDVTANRNSGSEGN